MTEILSSSAHISPLLRHMQAECERQRRELEEKADAKIKAIQEETEAEKTKLWESGLASLKKQEQEIIETTLKHARLDCDLRVKRKMSQAIDHLLSIAKGKLTAYSEGPAFESELEKLILEAVSSGNSFRKESSGTIGLLKVNPNHEAFARKVVESNGLDVSVGADPTITNGALLTVEGTPYSVTNTLSSRLEKQENAIRMGIAEMLNNELAGN